MADRMTSVEIEDVLSSIRRLVTDDLRPKPVMADSKLILTPALRVVADGPRLVESVAEDAPEDTLDVDLDSDLNAELQDAVSESQGELPEASASDQASSDAEPEAFPMFLHQNRRVESAFAPEFAESATQEAAETHGVGEAVSDIAAGIPADGYEAELGDVMAVPEWPESSWIAPDVIEVVEEAELIDVGGTTQETAHADWLTEPQAERHDLLDDHEADLAAEAALADLAAQEAGGLTELDEDMLREIVRDIIREELHGTLGERITRNVRKLVRAEINRAMLTQDMD